MKTIYLDYNATTPLDPEVIKTMRPYLESCFGNPSSSHKYGLEAASAISVARNQLAEMLSCSSEEIIFTSGGSESNNYALKGFAFANRDKGNHIITSSIEHPAILEVCKYLEKNGFEITYLSVDETGRLSLDEFKKAIRPSTILVSVMLANNEIGTIQPLQAIAKCAHEHDIIVHTDAAQAVGKIHVNIAKLGVDMLSVAGHKFYGPKGVGALYVKKGVNLESLIHGANQEDNRRAGTSNVLQIVGIGKAAELVTNNLDEDIEHSKRLRNILLDGLEEEIEDMRVNGHSVFCLPNTLSVSFANIIAYDLLSNLPSIASSIGSACKSSGANVSNTLEQINLPSDYILGTLRLSVGRFTSEKEVQLAIYEILKALKAK